MNTYRKLVGDLMKDLFVDYHCYIRDEMYGSAQKIKHDIFILFRNRHITKFDAFGWPLCLNEAERTRTAIKARIKEECPVASDFEVCRMVEKLLFLNMMKVKLN